jgi:predicted amidohydrolase
VKLAPFAISHQIGDPTVTPTHRKARFLLFGAAFLGLISCSPRATAQTPPKEIKVAAVQFSPRGSVEANTAAIVEYLAECSRRGARIAVFQECALTGYDKKVIAATSAGQIEQAEQKIARACRELNLYAVVGTPMDVDGVRYNVAVVLNPAGKRIERYAKIQLVSGDDWAKPGSQMSVFSVDGIPCSIIICHDSRYPELVRLPVLAGARLVLYPSSESSITQEEKIDPYRAQISARADENDVFIVQANSPALLSHGQSRIIRPDGKVICEASFFRDEIITATLDMSQASAATALKSLRNEALAEWWRQGISKVLVRN